MKQSVSEVEILSPILFYLLTPPTLILENRGTISYIWYTYEAIMWQTHTLGNFLMFVAGSWKWDNETIITTSQDIGPNICLIPHVKYCAQYWCFVLKQNQSSCKNLTMVATVISGHVRSRNARNLYWIRNSTNVSKLQTIL